MGQSAAGSFRRRRPEANGNEAGGDALSNHDTFISNEPVTLESGRRKRVYVAGAGLREANGTYVLAPSFAGAEVFVKESGELGSIYIRRVSRDKLERWVITTSASTSQRSHLYKRDGALRECRAPPLFDWETCTSDDGVATDYESQLGNPPTKLEYYHAFPSDLKFPEHDGDAPVKPRQRSTHPDTFISSTACLQVAIISADNLSGGFVYANDPYCVCIVSGKPHTEVKTLPKLSTLNPEWRQTFEVSDFEKDDELLFRVESDQFLFGQYALKHGDILPHGFVGDLCLGDPDGESSNEAKLSICITPVDKEIPGIRLEVDKNTGNVGIALVPDWSRGDSLFVRSIAKGGLIDLWNAHNPMQQVRLRDQLVEVNGKRGTCASLLTELAQSRGKVQLMVKRTW